MLEVVIGASIGALAAFGSLFISGACYLFWERRKARQLEAAWDADIRARRALEEVRAARETELESVASVEPQELPVAPAPLALVSTPQ